MKRYLYITALTCYLSMTATFAQLGVNLNSVSDYSPQLPFADAIKMARCIGSPAVPYDCKFGHTIPNEPFGVFVYTDVPQPGTYKVSFNGKADLSGTGTVQNLKYDLTSNLTTADFVMETGAMSLKFLNITSPVSNISVMRPGLTKDQLFNPAFLESLKPYSTLRFMDWLRTNASPITKWSERKLPTELSQTGSRGVALEYVAELANQTGKDLWVNVPVQADEDYIRNMAKLLKEKVKPGLKILVEHSNEVWNTSGGSNGAFAQSFQLLAMAKAAVAAGETDLQMGVTTDLNDWYWQRRLHAKRTVKISLIFREVFGDAAMGSRIQIVLAGHSADQSKVRAGLQYIEKYYSPVNKHIHHVAIAPYFATSAHLLSVKDPITGKTTTTVRPEATIETVLTGSQGSINSNAAAWVSRRPWDGKSHDVNHREFADYFKLKLTFYESGHHLNNLIGASLVKQTKLDPRFKDLYKDYFMKFFTANPEGLAMQFADISSWSKGTEFGATYQLGVETPQILALKEVSALVNKVIDPRDQEIAALKAELEQAKADLLEKESKIILCGAELQKSQNETRACSAEKSNLQSIINAVKSALNP